MGRFPSLFDTANASMAAPVRSDDVGHQPYVPDSESPAELTIGAIVLGCVLGLVFSASSVYLALKVGLTVSASIPISVLSITIFRWISKTFGGQATILQNNMVQTTGSAGESIAAGVVFTLPALLLLGYELPWTTVTVVGLIGGLLGVLLMIPLRQSLIVKEHHNLRYPEGTAAANVLIVGEERGSQAKLVFMGFGLGALYKFLNAGLHLWAEVPSRIIEKVVGGKRQLFGEMQAEVSPELTGVGYIIGPLIAGYMVAGGILSYFVLIPAVKLFGAGLTEPMFPATKLIAEMSPGEVRSNYVFYIGAGAVTAAGLISLARSLPTIWAALTHGVKDVKLTDGGDRPRTQRDLPMSIVSIGSLVLLAALVVVPQIHVNVVGAILILFFAFLFVTVSSRITGQIGASSNPISGMTIATVLLTSLIFLAIGWTHIEHRVLALSIGGVVCVAAAVAGATSQDLKTGYLVGATPARQQIGLLFGVTTSALLIGGTIHFLNEARTTIVPKSYPGVQVNAIEEAPTKGPDGQTYRVGRLYEQTGVAVAGRYLVDQQGVIKYVIDPGIGGRETKNWDGKEIDKLDSPKSQIMALVVDGILSQKLPWGLILIGAFIAITIELMGVNSLAVAVGVYLPLSTSATIFFGGMIRWLVERRGGAVAEDEDSGPGVLFSSGLIAGGAIMGVILAAVVGAGKGDAISLEHALGPMAENNLVASIAFGVFLLVPLYLVARRKKA